jgi:hypothetical protein
MKKPELPAFALGALAIVAIVVLLLANKVVPTYLYAIAVAAISGGLGVTIPSGSTGVETVGAWIRAEIASALAELSPKKPASAPPVAPVAPLAPGDPSGAVVVSPPATGPLGPQIDPVPAVVPAPAPVVPVVAVVQ